MLQEARTTNIYDSIRRQSRAEDKKFLALASGFALTLLLVMIFMNMQDLHKPDRQKIEKLPPQLAKVILKKKEEIK